MCGAFECVRVKRGQEFVNGFRPKAQKRVNECGWLLFCEWIWMLLFYRDGMIRTCAGREFGGAEQRCCPIARGRDYGFAS